MSSDTIQQPKISLTSYSSLLKQIPKSGDFGTGSGNPAFPSVQSAKTYPQLVQVIRKTIREGKLRAQDAVEREKVRTSWEIGKHILDHVLLNQSRAGYGQQVVEKLSKDLGISRTELGYMVEFAKTYPISRPVGKLSWAHYQKLLAINDDKVRSIVAAEAEKKNWSRKQLVGEIKKIKSSGKTVPVKIPSAPTLGKVGVYCIVLWGKRQETGDKEKPKKLQIDLGFRSYLDLPDNVAVRLKENDMIEFDPKVLSLNPRPLSLKSDQFSEADLYTYEAQIEDVVDGDTVWAYIHLGFGVWQHHRLRLRATNAAEIESKEGEQAKRVLEKILKFRVPSLESRRKPKQKVLNSQSETQNSKLVIKTTKTDQYGRYLVDIYLNNVHIDAQLLKSGLFSYRGNE